MLLFFLDEFLSQRSSEEVWPLPPSYSTIQSSKRFFVQPDKAPFLWAPEQSHLWPAILFKSDSLQQSSWHQKKVTSAEKYSGGKV